tara:strand:- start:83 stop:253 length:171 start_codon:yes stop_codon:yes gene_type:complete
MNTIKFLKENYIKLNNITYKPYKVCELPERFGMVDDNGFSYFTEWFNYKGLTYIAE